MPYTRQQMINHLMWFESDYIDDHADHQPEYTKDSWLAVKFAEYQNMDTERLSSTHEGILDGYYEDPEDVQLLLESDKRKLESGIRKEWV